MTEKEIFAEIVKSYRLLIEERYEYENLIQKYDLPETFNEERVTLFRNYFLDYIYPELSKREELNKAFDSLDDYLKNPEKLIRLIVDSGQLIFKHGRHLPSISMAGIRALRSFLKASKFEDKLVASAVKMQLEPPYYKEEIETLLQSLSREEIEDFIDSSKVLFGTLNDRVLVKKIIDIVRHLIKKMRKRPDIYSETEVRGLEIGFEIIERGNHLFEQLPKADQEIIFDFVIKIERDVLEEIFSKKEA